MKKTFMFISLACLMVSMGCAKKPASANAAPVQTEQAQEVVEAPKASVVKTIPANVRGKDILPAIAANYKGKVALVDLWATWCPPCRMAMKKIDEIKGDLAAKGCVFVYVTGETSPEADWSKMIGDIAGDHYRLTDQQWSELCSELGVPGIPAYLLLGKDGKIVYDNLSQGGYPGSEILKNNIEVALTK